MFFPTPSNENDLADERRTDLNDLQAVMCVDDPQFELFKARSHI